MTAQAPKQSRVIDVYDRIILGNPGATIVVLLVIFAFFSFWSKDFQKDA